MIAAPKEEADPRKIEFYFISTQCCGKQKKIFLNTRKNEDSFFRAVENGEHVLRLVGGAAEPGTYWNARRHGSAQYTSC
jgi:hypothetical protein